MKELVNKDLPRNPKKYFEERRDEFKTPINGINDLANFFKAIDSLLRELLTPLPKPPIRSDYSNPTEFDKANAEHRERLEKLKQPHEEAFQEVIEEFIEIASEEQLSTDENRQGKFSPLEIKIPE